MKKSFLFILIIPFLLCGILAKGQGAAVQPEAKGQIKGALVDSLSKKSLDFMTVALKKDNQVVRTMVTQSNGEFTFEKVAPAKYTLVIIALGYASKTIPVEVHEKSLSINLGRIPILSQVNTLNDVAIVADKPLVKQEVDRISYDIQADPESKVNNVLDMMRKIPLLSVDAEDNIKLKGSGSYKILINGKPSSLVANDPKEVFKSMPAANIQKIEVITTPPAKYDSEGLVGLINIITNKKVDAGYNGSLSYRQSFPAGGPGGSGSVTIKEGKLGISGYGGISTYSNPQTLSTSNRISHGTSPTNLQQIGGNEYKGNFNYWSTELSYEIDSLNLITAEFSSNASTGKSVNNQLSKLFDGASNLTQGYSLNNNSKNGWDGMNAGLNYQLGFKKNKDQLLTFSYKLNKYGNNQFSNLNIDNRINYAAPNYQQNNDGSSTEQTIQADYVQPISKKFNLEAGLKGILRDNRSEFQYKQFDAASNDYVVDPSRTNNFKNIQNVYGLYNSYQYNLKNWGFKGGVRLELTTINADFISQATQLNKDFYNLIPSVSVNRKFKNFSSLNFGYTQRIERPGIWQLNPFVNRSNPNFEYSGNPDLKPVVSNNFDLSYSKFKKGSVNIGLSYAFANNTIQNISVYNETTNITRSTYLNVGKDRKLGSNINISYPITKALNFNMGGNLYYVWLQGMVNGNEYKNDGMQGYLYAYAGYKLKSGWRLGANYSYSSPWITLQGQSNAYHYTSMSVNKDLIKDKLSISGSVSNPFQKMRAWQNTMQGANFIQSSYSENYYRRFNASMNWRFGKLKESIKKNKRGINNDDVKGGDGGKSGN